MNLRILLTITLVASSIRNMTVDEDGQAKLILNSGASGFSEANYLNAGASGMGVALVSGGSLEAAAAAGLNNGVTTQNYQLAPKYLTEKIVRQPKIITETVVQPIYERTINRPSLHTERYEAEANLVQSEPVVKNSSKVNPVTETSAVINKNVNVPGYTRFIQPVIQPTLLVQTETVDVRDSQPQINKTPAEMLPVKNTSEERVRNMNVPGAVIHNRTFVQPILTRENVSLDVQRAPTRRIVQAPVTDEVVVQNRLNTQRVVVPARSIFNQRIIQPTHRLERVNVNLIQSQPTSETREVIVKPTIRKRNVQKQYHNVLYKVPIAREVQIVKPYYVKVNDLRTEFVPVDERGNALSADQAASVLGTDGFAFNNDSSLNYADLQGNNMEVVQVAKEDNEEKEDQSSENRGYLIGEGLN